MGADITADVPVFSLKRSLVTSEIILELKVLEI